MEWGGGGGRGGWRGGRQVRRVLLINMVFVVKGEATRTWSTYTVSVFLPAGTPKISSWVALERKPFRAARRCAYGEQCVRVRGAHGMQRVVMGRCARNDVIKWAGRGHVNPIIRGRGVWCGVVHMRVPCAVCAPVCPRSSFKKANEEKNVDKRHTALITLTHRC